MTNLHKRKVQFVPQKCRIVQELKVSGILKWGVWGKLKIGGFVESLYKEQLDPQILFFMVSIKVTPLNPGEG